MADAREHFSEPETDLTLADLLGTPLDPFGRLVHLLSAAPTVSHERSRTATDWETTSSRNASDMDVRPCVGYLTPVRAKTEQWSGRPSQVSVFIDPAGLVFELLVRNPCALRDRRTGGSTRELAFAGL